MNITYAEYSSRPYRVFCTESDIDLVRKIFVYTHNWPGDIVVTFRFDEGLNTSITDWMRLDGNAITQPESIPSIITGEGQAKDSKLGG